MEEMTCKNCGEKIYKNRNGVWYHEDNMTPMCHPEEVAFPEEKKCQAEITIQGQTYKCILHKHNADVLHRTLYSHSYQCSPANKITYCEVIEW